MGHGITGWSPDIERRFKRYLFRFLEDVQSTKAALYLLTDDGRYAVAVQYGFGRRDRLAEVHGPQDPMLLRVREQRTKPWAANHPAEADDLAEYLEAAGTARIMLVPLYADSRVVGFVDARDKGRKQAFDRDDLRTASDIASGLVDEIRSSRLYPDLEPPSDTHDAVAALIDGEDGSWLGPPVDAAGMRELVRSADRLAQLEGVTAVGLAAVSARRAAARVVIGGDGRTFDRDPLLRHQEEALRSTGVEAPPLESWSVDQVTVAGSPGAGEQVIGTAVLDSARHWAVVASAVTVSGDRSASVVLHELRQMWDAGRRDALMRGDRRALLRRLLTPGQHSYSELVVHSEAVSRIAWSMARQLGLEDAIVEDAALAGLLHDVGMRELDYDRLYRHPSPGTEELRTYRRHPEVGARLLEGLGCDRIEAVVRSHHERWDGAGYPDRLAGDAIPELARIVHLAETWDVLTSPTSYRSGGSRADAETVIRREAGQQFDPRLVGVLLDVVG